MKKIKELIYKQYPELFNELISRTKPTIGIKTIKEKKESNYSKFGGLPIITNNFEWPSFDNSLLSFMAQIDLEDVNKITWDVNMPKSGILYFFMLNNPSIGYPSEKVQFKVIYIDDLKDNLSILNPSERVNIFKETYMEFYSHYTFKKDIEYNEYIDDVIDDTYNQVCEMNSHNPDGGHQIYGNPFSLQNPVFYWWALKEAKARGIALVEEQEALLEEEYTLLLQIDFADNNSDFHVYGADGMAYFGIKKQDLKNRNFNESKLVCQN